MHPRATLTPCTSCGAPTTTEVCAFCRLVTRAGGQLPAGDHDRRLGTWQDAGNPNRGTDAVLVELGPPRRGGDR